MTTVDSRHTILTAVVGSHLHGNARPGSDIDLFSIHADPTFDLVGIGRPPQPTFHVQDGNDHVSWEVGFFISKALGGEINSLETLWADTYRLRTPWADDLLDLRQDFLSQRIANRWLGFAASDLDRVRKLDPQDDEIKLKKSAFQILRVIDMLDRVWTTGVFRQMDESDIDLATWWIDDNADYHIADQLSMTIDIVRSTVNDTATPLPREPYTEDIAEALRAIRYGMMRQD